jgi:hypothetical protein
LRYKKLWPGSIPELKLHPRAFRRVLRHLAEELAGGVETLTPRVQERLKRAGPKGAAQVLDPVPVEAGRPASRKWWGIGALLAMVAAGVGVWRSLQASGEEQVPSSTVKETGGAAPDADPDLVAGRM